MAAYYGRDMDGSPTLLIIDTPEIINTSTTEVSVSISTLNMTVTPTKYFVQWYKINSSGVPVGTVNNQEFTSNPFTLAGLSAGTEYQISVTAYNGSTFGNTVIRRFGTSIEYGVAGSTGVALDPTKAAAAKSFLRMTNSSTNPKEHSVAYRSFNAITLPTITTTTVKLGVKNTQTINRYSTSYYAFGTKLFVDSIIDKSSQSAGFGFFIDNNGNDGYYVMIETTETAAAANKKEVRICKVRGGDISVLNDTQRNTVSTLNGVYGGRAYNIDIKVYVNLSSVKIDAYINGFRITATDSTGIVEGEDGQSILNKMIAPSKSIASICKKGEAIFDYVYGTDITDKMYNSSSFVKNMYQGTFSNDYLNMGFGDIIYNSSVEEDNQAKPAALDEFGTSVREIKKVSLRYNSAPAYPIKFSTGLNKSAKILGSKLSNFGGEAYVLNNSAALTPLNDQESATFYLYGDTIAPSGTLEYQTDILSDYINQEPVVFESSWLQNLSDVESLGKWIKSNIVNKGKIINMSIFGNPFISVGDIISIKYSYQGLDGTQKFIVTNVRHSFNQGLDTEIVCRTL
jgi:hypothetical protein